MILYLLLLYSTFDNSTLTTGNPTLRAFKVCVLNSFHDSKRLVISDDCVPMLFARLRFMRLVSPRPGDWDLSSGKVAYAS